MLSWCFQELLELFCWHFNESHFITFLMMQNPCYHQQKLSRVWVSSPLLIVFMTKLFDNKILIYSSKFAQLFVMHSWLLLEINFLHELSHSRLKASDWTSREFISFYDLKSSRGGEESSSQAFCYQYKLSISPQKCQVWGQVLSNVFRIFIDSKSQVLK